MIAWFSGTGNSKAVAGALAAATGVRLLRIAPETSGRLVLNEGEALGLVFPVYSWGMPNVVCRFVDRLEVQSIGTPYVYMVCTCGDDIGRTDRLLSRRLVRRGLRLSAAWSVRMPNTYTALPGFDTDAGDVVRQKLAAAFRRVAYIARMVGDRAQGVTDVVPGRFAAFKSYVVRPLFNAFMVSDRLLSHSASCIGCRRCAAACPVGNIRVSAGGSPRWQGHCTGCLACYHVCPTHCVAYGPWTRGKGQYVFPSSGQF